MPAPTSTASSSANNASGRGGNTLVLCFDGTGDEFDAENTNVVKLFSMLDKSDTTKQVVYYQTGIGTYGPPGLITSIGLKIAKFMDFAFAWYLSAHVMGGYRFIMDNYQSGDKICLFGFSRGAYTARALAAMIHMVGLLPRDNGEHVAFAWKLFENSVKEFNKKDSDVEKWHTLNFKKTFSREVEIDFLGIWDTVNSVGLVGTGLPYTAKNPIVKRVAHAIALDETRAKFRHKHWDPLTSDTPTKLPEATNWADYTAIVKSQAEAAMLKDRPKTVVEEVWFAGDHCDVGGGNTKYKEECALAHIALRWMVRQTLQHTTIRYDEDVLKIYGIRLNYPFKGGPLNLTQTRLEEAQFPYFRNGNDSLESYMDRERLDAISDIHSQYWGKMGLLWHALEFWPTVKETSKWWWPFKYYLGPPNLWSPRDPFRWRKKIKVHSSVRTRLQHNNGALYRSKINLKLDDVRVEWVEDWEEVRRKFVSAPSPPVGQLF